MSVKELRPGVFELESMEDIDVDKFLAELEEETEKKAATPLPLEGDDDSAAVSKA